MHEAEALAYPSYSRFMHLLMRFPHRKGKKMNAALEDSSVCTGTAPEIALGIAMEGGRQTMERIWE